MPARRFEVEPAVWELFPEARIAAILVSGIDNSRNADACAALLVKAATQTATAFADVEIPAHPVVAPWRAAYRDFGAKPARQRSSIESLIRSAVAGRLRSINPLVDLYNAVSLSNLLPCGGEDLAAVEGDIRLRRASGDEPFVPLGASESEPPWPGELIYADDGGALCRCWNWREAERTKLTEQTTSAFLCIEALPPTSVEQLRRAAEQLASAVHEQLGGEATVRLLDREQPVVLFP